MSPPRRRRRFTRRGRRRARAVRGGVTLLELVAVVTLLGVFAAVAVTRSDGRFGDVQVRTQARVFAGLLHQAKRRAILTGRDSGVRFVAGGPGVVAAVPVERAGGALVDLGPAVPFPESVSVSTDAPELLFDFEGLGPADGFGITFVGPARTWVVHLPPVSSMIRVDSTD